MLDMGLRLAVPDTLKARHDEPRNTNTIHNTVIHPTNATPHDMTRRGIPIDFPLCDVYVRPNFMYVELSFMKGMYVHSH